MAASSHTPLGLVASTSTSTAASLFAEPNTPHLLKRCFDHIREQLFTAIQNGTCDAKSILRVKRGKSISITLNNVTIQREHVSKKVIVLAIKAFLTTSTAERYPFESVAEFLGHLVLLQKEADVSFSLAERGDASKLYKAIYVEIKNTIRLYKEKLLEARAICNEEATSTGDDFYFNKFSEHDSICAAYEISEKMTTHERIKLFMEVGCIDTRNEMFIIGHKRIIKILLKRGVRPDTWYSLQSPDDFAKVLSRHFHGMSIDPKVHYGKVGRVRDNFSILLVWYLDNDPEMAGALIQNSKTFFWPNDLHAITTIASKYIEAGNIETL